MTDALWKGRPPVLLREVRSLRRWPLQRSVAGIRWRDAALVDGRHAACGPQLIGQGAQSLWWERLEGGKAVDGCHVCGEGFDSAWYSLQPHRIGLPAVAEEASEALHCFCLRLQCHIRSD